MTFFPGTKYCFFVVFTGTVDVTAFLTGSSLVWSSPIIAKLESNNTSDIPLGRQISNEEESWIGSLSAMGGIFAPIIFGYLVQAIGRKAANTLVAIPFLIGFLIAAFAETISLFYVARIFMGMGIGGVYSVIPIYIVEIAENCNRGLLSSSITVCIMAGMLFSYVMGSYASIMAFNLTLASFCIIYIPVFWYIAPETPYYLIGINKEEKALKSLYYLRRRDEKDLLKEISEIKLHLDELQRSSFWETIKSKGTIKGFSYSIILTTFQQFSGINVILFYTHTIFSATGSDIPSEICSIIVASVQFIASFATPLGADKFGRKLMLLVSITGATIAEIILGVYFYLDKNGNDVSNIYWLPIFSLVIFIMFYNFGMGSLPWVIMAEFLPSNITSKAVAAVTSFYWFTGFFWTYYFRTLSDAIGMAGSFWLFAGICFAYFFFVFFFLFETKGKSLKEIRDILNTSIKT